MTDPFYVLGESYKLIGYKEPLIIVGFDDKYVHFEWMGGLKYWVIKDKRHINMYKRVRKWTPTLDGL
jgi:hypothetical protein